MSLNIILPERAQTVKEPVTCFIKIYKTCVYKNY